MATAFPSFNSWSEIDDNFWTEPKCLIGSREDDTLEIIRETLIELQRVTCPVEVVTIAGPYRTGKSYLMNRLAGKTKGSISTLYSVVKVRGSMGPGPRVS